MGILLVNMVRALPPQSSFERTRLICCQHLTSQPIRVGCWFDPVFSFLDDRHFVIPSVLAERPGEILLNIYRLCPCPQSGQQPVPPPAIICSYALSVSDVLETSSAPCASSQTSAPAGPRDTVTRTRRGVCSAFRTRRHPFRPRGRPSRNYSSRFKRSRFTRSRQCIGARACVTSRSLGGSSRMRLGRRSERCR